MKTKETNYCSCPRVRQTFTKASHCWLSVLLVCKRISGCSLWKKKEKKKDIRMSTLNSKPILSANKDSLAVVLIMLFPNLVWSVCYTDRSFLARTREGLQERQLMFCRWGFDTKNWAWASTAHTEICGSCNINNQLLKSSETGSKIPSAYPLKWGYWRIKANIKLEKISRGTLVQPPFKAAVGSIIHWGSFSLPLDTKPMVCT